MRTSVPRWLWGLGEGWRCPASARDRCASVEIHDFDFGPEGTPSGQNERSARRLSRWGITNLMTRRRLSAYREAPHGRSSRVLTKAPVLPPLHSIGCFPLRTSTPSYAEKSSNISRIGVTDVTAVHEIADEIQSTTWRRYDKIIRYSAAPRAAMRFNGVVILWVAMVGLAAIFFLAQ